MSDTERARASVAALRSSHDRLAGLAAALVPDQVTGPSYCTDWTLAQVFSHLGSGSEIFSGILDAVLAERELPSRDDFQAYWDDWNSKSPAEQASDCVRADEEFVRRIESLDEEQLAGIRVSLFGMDLEAAGLFGMRLSEHALHTWDIAVIVDPTAAVAPDAVDLLIDHLGHRVARGGQPTGEPMRVHVRTTDPERELLLSVGVKGVELTEWESPRQLDLPAETLVRLVYGRLDAEHTPAAVTARGIELDALRAIFPGP